MGHPVARVQHHASGPPRSIQGEDGLDRDVHLWHVESLEHDLCHLLAVSFRIQGCLCQQNRVLLWRDPQLAEEGVMPNLLHVVPTGNDAVLNGIVQAEDTTDRNSFVTCVVLLGLRSHDNLVEWPAHYRGEHRPWCVISSEASFDHSTPVVDHKAPPPPPPSLYCVPSGSPVFL